MKSHYYTVTHDEKDLTLEYTISNHRRATQFEPEEFSEVEILNVYVGSADVIYPREISDGLYELWAAEIAFEHDFTEDDRV
jgi:hypothetical protein